MATIDIELTNRCNAVCSFCPRDAMPQQGVMQPDVFEQSLARAVEYAALARDLPSPTDVTVTFCGTGDPLVHRRAEHWVGRVRDAGLPCELSTNGALLSHERAVALLDAGLVRLNVNVSDLGDEYERVYGLLFEQTRDNVERFVALSRGRCEVVVVLVDHRRDEAHLREAERFWRARGVDLIFPFGLINRGGSLRIPASLLPGDDVSAGAASAPGLVCPAPFMHLFVGWNGRYYLCSSDWQKEVDLGSVFDTSLAAITAEKLARVVSRQPICARCTLDPQNLMRHRLADDATRSRPFDVTPAELADIDRRTRAFADAVLAALPGSPRTSSA